MRIDVLSIIRSRREQRAAGIEELAQRLAKGEAIAPEEIEAHLERTGCEPEELQERVDTLERRADLLATVSAGNKAQAKLDKLQAEVDEAHAAVVKAQESYTAVRAKHDEPMMLLSHQVRQGERASDLLVAPENLSPVDRDRLAAARQAAADAAERLNEGRGGLRDMRLSLEQAERVYADAVDHAKANRSNADVQAHKQRSENAVNSRKARLADAEAELPQLKAAADKAEAAVAAIEAELRR